MDDGTQSTRDTVEKDDKWSFDDEVTHSFDDMLERSIPQYSVMRTAVTALASQVLESIPGDDRCVIDLGTSRGRAVQELVERYRDTTRFVLCELSEPMLEAARDLYATDIAEGRVRVERRDLRTDYPVDEHVSVVLSILTLQFVPVNYRQRIVQQVFDQLEPGGAFVLVEKVIGDGPLIDDWMIDLYHGHKHRAGYSYESIDRKRRSLEGVLVPNTARQNVELLERAGFAAVDCFWRWMNFAGWIAVKR